MTVTVSLALLLAMAVFLLCRYAGLKSWHAAVCIMLGFYLASTGFAPFDGAREHVFFGRDYVFFGRDCAFFGRSHAAFASGPRMGNISLTPGRRQRARPRGAR